MRLFLAVLFIISGAFGADDDPERPLVKTALGEILGFQKLSFSGRVFSVFDGIPFAKPPTGELRFKDPVPIDPWNGQWDARLSYVCIQTSFQLDSTLGQEDCLYLNVNVPREKVDPKENLDVIVHIHGGAYVWGSGHMYAHPELLMDKDVIFVTMNYRLSMFGFLSTQDSVVPGNMGLKDQTLALKWVKEHISNFGGNPDSITLTGLSAGSGSAHLHYLSPLSKGLFHRGFSQSGTALNCWNVQEEPVKKAKLLADSVGCPPDGSTQELVDCLRQRPADHIISRTPLFYGYSVAPYVPFGPVIEKNAKGAFLSKNPYYLMAKGEIQDLPWIASIAADEGTFPGTFIQKDLETVDKNWTTLAPHLLDINYTLARTLHPSTVKAVRDYYFEDGEEINNETFGKLIKMFGDRLFVVDAELAARLQAKVNKQPVYFYYFNYKPEGTEYAAHGGDGKYFFYKMYGKPLTGQGELKMKDLLIDMLVNYAKTGKATIEGVNWEPTGSKQLTYLNVSGPEPENIKLLTVDEIAPRGFWKSQGFLENDNVVLIKDEL